MPPKKKAVNLRIWEESKRNILGYSVECFVAFLGKAELNELNVGEFCRSFLVSHIKVILCLLDVCQGFSR